VLLTVKSKLIIKGDEQMRSRKGLTLIELLIVIIILGALAAIAIPRISTSARAAKTNACNTNVDTLNTAIEMYKIDKGDYPGTLAILTADVNYFSPSDVPTCPYTTGYGYTGNRVPVHDHTLD
jgi:general secretion pathway protein G